MKLCHFTGARLCLSTIVPNASSIYTNQNNLNIPFVDSFLRLAALNGSTVVAQRLSERESLFSRLRDGNNKSFMLRVLSAGQLASRLLTAASGWLRALPPRRDLAFARVYNKQACIIILHCSPDFLLSLFVHSFLLAKILFFVGNKPNAKSATAAKLSAQGGRIRFSSLS